MLPQFLMPKPRRAIRCGFHSLMCTWFRLNYIIWPLHINWFACGVRRVIGISIKACPRGGVHFGITFGHHHHPGNPYHHPRPRLERNANCWLVCFVSLGKTGFGVLLVAAQCTVHSPHRISMQHFVVSHRRLSPVAICYTKLNANCQLSNKCIRI